MRLPAIFLGILALAAGGTSADPVQTAPPDPSAAAPSGRTYISTSVAGHTLVDGTQITLTFGTDGNLSAQAGCNTLGTTYTIDQGKLVAANFGGTEMGCDAPRHAQDQWISNFLSSRPTIAAQDDGLVLVAGDTTLTMRDRESVQKDSPLTGTTWIADTIIAGDAASSVPEKPKVFVKFADGKVTGSDGCNGFGGTAEVGSGTITFREVGSELKLCPDGGPAEKALQDLVKGKVTVEPDGERLTLTSPSGNGLGFRAESAGG